MADYKCVLVIRAANKVLFETNSSRKYELISVEQDISPDGAKQYVQQIYKLHVSDCQELLSCRIPKSRIYYVCVEKPQSEPPYGRKWFTLSTAASKLPDESAYDGLREFLRYEAELSNVQLQFGLRDGKIVAVGELSPDERGLKCGCVCPSLRWKLSGQAGNKKTSAFCALQGNRLRYRICAANGTTPVSQRAYSRSEGNVLSCGYSPLWGGVFA